MLAGLDDEHVVEVASDLLELGAVRALAGDLRAELHKYERLRPGP